MVISSVSPTDRFPATVIKPFASEIEGPRARAKVPFKLSVTVNPAILAALISATICPAAAVADVRELVKVVFTAVPSTLAVRISPLAKNPPTVIVPLDAVSVGALAAFVSVVTTFVTLRSGLKIIEKSPPLIAPTVTFMPETPAVCSAVSIDSFNCSEYTDGKAIG